MRTRHLLVATLAALAVGLASSAATAAPECPTILVRSPQERAGFTMGVTRISTSAAIDIEFDVLLTELDAKDHVLQLRLVLPNGDLYQVVDVPITGGTGTPLSAGAGSTLKGYPRAVARSKTEWFKLGLAHYRMLRVPFPIAGTAIVHNTLHGRWSVEAYLDGSDSPCGRAAQFVVGR